MQELEFRSHSRQQNSDSDSASLGWILRGSVSEREEANSCSQFIRWRSTRKADEPLSTILFPPFEFCKEVRIWLYSTCAPCGDASMELCMAAQKDPTPWPVHANSPEKGSPGEDPKGRLLDGRAHFSILGVVRRKPSRADAESTLSKSCSDKLAMKQVASLLSFPTSLLIAPSPNAYLAGLILPEDEISHVACERAFGKNETGRLKSLNDKVWIHPSSGREEYKFHTFEVRALSRQHLDLMWEFSKPINTKIKCKPGRISAVWTAPVSQTISKTPLGRAGWKTVPVENQGFLSSPHETSKSPMATALPDTALSETLANGVKQGYSSSAFTSRKASALSRAKKWKLIQDVVRLLASINTSDRDGTSTVVDRCRAEESSGENPKREDIVKLELLRDWVISSPTYDSLKQRAADAGFTQLRSEVIADVKRAFGNWIENRGDERWGLEVLDDAGGKNVG